MTIPKGSKTAKGRAPKAAKAPPPTAEEVAARLLAGFDTEAAPTLWKEADLKRRLSAKERPALGAALARLRNERRVLTLPQGKTTLYLFATPLRDWLAASDERPARAASPAADTESENDLLAVYGRLVRASGGFPDVKIAALQAALGSAGDDLPERLRALWREGSATFSQGDWSLADEATRAAAVELSGERYLLVRLEEA